MKTRHAPQKMTRQYNVTQAMMKVGTAPLKTLTDAMIESIARTHRVPVEELRQRVADRRAREVVS